MSPPLFSLNIQEDVLSGVMLQTQGDRSVITGCGAVRTGDRSLRDGIAAVMKQAGCAGGPCRVCLEADHFFFRNLTFPFAERKKITDALPFALEETAPLEIENLLVDALVTPRQDKTADVAAAMIRRDVLADHLVLLEELGLDPEIVTVSGVPTALRLAEHPGGPADFIFLDIGLRRVAMIAVGHGRIAVIRVFGFDGARADLQMEEDPAAITVGRPEHLPDVCADLAAAVRQTLRSAGLRVQAVPVYLSGPACRLHGLPAALKDALQGEVGPCDLLRARPVVATASDIEGRWRPSIMDQALAVGLQPGAGKQTLNFRKGPFAREVSWRRHPYLSSKIGIAVAAVAIVAFCALLGDVLVAKIEERRLAARIRTVFTATLPEVTRIVEPVAQLQAEIKRLKAGGMRGGGEQTVVELLAEISARIPVSLPVRLTQMVVDDQGIRLKGTTTTFNAVETMKVGLEKSPHFQAVIITAANLSANGKEVLFEMKIQPSGS